MGDRERYLARAWKRKAKLLRYILNRKYKEDEEWISALRLAGIGKMSDLNPDAIRLTITVPSQKRIAEMVEEARHQCEGYCPCYERGYENGFDRGRDAEWESNQ